MNRFINPFTDIGFKRIFGQELSKPLLMDFLNSLLVGEREIVSLSFLDKEQPAVYDEDRSLIYDIYCELVNGEKIIVEMQNKEQPYFKERSIYYISESISRQGEKGTAWHYDIKAVYLVAFLNFKQAGIGDCFRTDVALMDMRTHRLFSDKLRLIYLQLPYFTKEADDCESDFDRWIYVLRNMETFKRLPWMAQKSVFERLAEIADVSSMSKEDRLKYDEGLRKYRDTLSVMEGQRLKGLEEGLEKGRAKGRVEGRAEGEHAKALEIACQLKSLGMDVQTIAVTTGLTFDEIKEL